MNSPDVYFRKKSSRKAIAREKQNGNMKEGLKIKEDIKKKKLRNYRFAQILFIVFMLIFLLIILINIL